MKLVILILELSFVWLVYFAFGVATEYDMPVWLTALLVIFVDRTVTFITTFAQSRRARMQD